MPKMVRFLLENAAVGIVAGWVLLSYLLVSDIYGLGHLVFSSASPAMPVFLLMAGFAITFGSASMGIAIMTLPYLQNGGGGKPKRLTTMLSYFIVSSKLVQQPQPVSFPGSRGKDD